MKEEFINFPAGCEGLPFYVILAGTSYCDGSYRIGRAESNCLVMEYVLSGEGTIYVDGRKYIAGEGDFYMLAPGSRHYYYSDEENPWVKIWVNASGPLAAKLLEIYNPGNLVVFPDPSGGEYIRQIHRIGNESGSDGAREKHDRAAGIFLQLLQHLHGRVYRQRVKYGPETSRLKEYIDSRVTESVSLKELSELVYLSESQVIRIFKKDMGVTPYEYILEKKLEHAGLLLRSTGLMIKEIAYELGFCDEHYFSYLFRKKMGMTPTAYRREGDLEKTFSVK